MTRPADMGARSMIPLFLLLDLLGCMPLRHRDGCDLGAEAAAPTQIRETAATGVVQIRFWRSGTTDSVPGVLVYSERPRFHAYAKDAASVAIALSPGRYTLRVRRYGYANRTLPITVAPGRGYELEVPLGQCAVTLSSRRHGRPASRVAT